MPLFSSTTKGYPYIQGTQNASLIDDYALELANKLEAVVPYAIAAGTVSVTLTASTSGTASVTFPTGRFSVAPIVQLTKVSSSGSATLTIPMATAVSSTSMTVGLYATATQTVTVTIHYVAIQMTTSTANG